MDVPSVSAGELDARAAAGWTLLDVRTPEEWATGHIPGAVHLPMNELVERLDEVDGPVVCVCHVGGRSARVTQYLVGQGREAVNLAGGMDAYAAAGLPVVLD